MNSFFPNWTASNYNSNQYFRLWEDSLEVGSQMGQLYWQAWNEFYTSPQTLTRRNWDYLREVSSPPQPAWQTPNRLVDLPAPFSSLVKLLDFSQPAENVGQSQMIPTLVLPPQAGHHSYIADYSAEQSQMQTLRQSGLEAVYCIEWLGATKQTAHSSIEDYIAVVDYCIEKIGGKANLVGDCQGGWLAAIYAAIYPHKVNSLTVAGAPIDFQAGDGAIKQAVNYNSQTYPDQGMSFYRQLVAMGGGVLNGSFLISGFNLMKPAQLPLRFIDLYRTIDNPAALKRYRQMKDWYDYPQNIAGTFYLWLVQHLFRDNELILDKLMVGGQVVELGQITCPLFLLAGTRDHITPASQVFAMAAKVGTPSNQIEQFLVDGGHIGLFMGHDILKNNWSEIGGKLAQISR